MLSGETAVGKYPIEAIECMARIALETENHLRESGIRSDGFNREIEALDDPITQAVCDLAEEAKAAAIVLPSLSGRLGKVIARHRPWQRVVATAPTDDVAQSLALVWGIHPVRMSPVAPGMDRLSQAVSDAFAAGEVRVGERVVVLAGFPTAGGPRFPTIRVVKIGPGGGSEEP
jgi:pyruvate kinase